MNARIMIISNDMPDLRDSTGALASRFLPLEINVQGFLGREDFNLKRTLQDELPGIFTWALEGADRLWEREGRFTIGASVQASMLSVERSSSPIKAFASDCLAFDPSPESVAPKEAVYEAYAMWCASEGFMPKGKSVFFRDLLAAYRGELEVGKNRVDGKLVPMLRGARLGSEI